MEKEKTLTEINQLKEELEREKQIKEGLLKQIASLEDNLRTAYKFMKQAEEKLTKEIHKNQKNQHGFFRSTNVFRLIGLAVLMASSYIPSPDVNILGIAGNALALTGVVLVASPTLTEIFKRVHNKE